jgi:hypothetical protein
MNDGPDFFVIGAQKAGTTRLCGLLDSNPGISVPTKEPMFFQSADDMASKEHWYRALFLDSPKGTIKGDGSTYYSMCSIYPGTAQRIHAFNPEAKIIYVVRHPLRRIESAWVQLLSVGHANSVRGFDYTLKRTELLMDPSRYWKQLSEYRRYFSDEQIRIYFFEELVTDEAATLRSCCSFLGADLLAHVELGEDEFRNASDGKRGQAMIFDAVRMFPGYETLERLIPVPVKVFLTEHVTRPIKSVQWKPQTLEWAIRELRQDAGALLAHTGRSADYWGMP